MIKELLNYVTELIANVSFKLVEYMPMSYRKIANERHEMGPFSLRKYSP